MKKYEIDNFPARVVSKMTPQGTSVDRNVLSLLNNPSANRELGEAAQMMRYFGYDVYFGFNTEENEIWVRVELPEGREFGNSHREKLEDILKRPEFLSHNKKMKNTYEQAISKGKISEKESSQQYFTVNYKLKTVKDKDKIFEAFWFNLKPVFKTIYDLH